MGKLQCLSVSEGDIEITFDNTNAAEAIRAKRMIPAARFVRWHLTVEMSDGD